MESTGYHGSDIEPRAAAQKEKRIEWKEEKSIFCFFVQGFHKQSHKWMFQSLDQLQPRNETSHVLRRRCWKQTRASLVQMNIIINNNFCWISAELIFPQWLLISRLIYFIALYTVQNVAQLKNSWIIRQVSLFSSVELSNSANVAKFINYVKL